MLKKEICKIPAKATKVEKPWQRVKEDFILHIQKKWTEQLKTDLPTITERNTQIEAKWVKNSSPLPCLLRAPRRLGAARCGRKKRASHRATLMLPLAPAGPE